MDLNESPLVGVLEVGASTNEVLGDAVPLTVHAALGVEDCVHFLADLHGDLSHRPNSRNQI